MLNAKLNIKPVVSTVKRILESGNKPYNGCYAFSAEKQVHMLT